MRNFTLFILIAAFLQRLIYSTIIHPPETFLHSDMEIYGRISDAILRGEWKISHFFQPVGFPVLVAGIKLLTPRWTTFLSVFQAVLGALTLTFIGLSVRAFWGRATEAAFLVAGLLHVPWIIYTGYAMPETTYTFLLSVLLWASVGMVRGRGHFFTVLWGVSFILAFWVKGQHALLFPLFFCGLIYFKKKFTSAILLSVIVSAGLALHWSFSYAKTGKGRISADAGGLNFVEGKCPSKKNTDPETNITWWSPLYHSLHMGEHKRWDRPFSDSSYYMREGAKCILKNPWVMVQSFESVPFLFFGNSLWPTNWQPFGEKVRLYELLFVFFAIPGLLFFFLGLALHRRIDELLVWGLPVLSLFLCVYIFKSEIRYRIPFDIFIIPMSLEGWKMTVAALHRSGASPDLAADRSANYVSE